MQPSYVSTIRKKVQEQIDFATDSSIPVEKTEIYRKMKNIQTWYKPEWIGLETEETVHPAAQKLDVSLFEIPLIMKAAMPASETNDERLLKLLQVMLKESAGYLAGFSSPEELAGKIRTFISDQYDKFTESLKTSKKRIPMLEINLFMIPWWPMSWIPLRSSCRKMVCMIWRLK